MTDTTPTGPAARPEASATPRRRPVLLAWAALGIVVVAVLAAASWNVEQGRRWLKDVVVYDYAAGIHTTSPIPYLETPPVGGAHNPVWQNCGIFTEPVSDVHTVHALEHGAVWITYRADLVNAADRDHLESIAGRNDYVIMSPYPEQEHAVVVTAWNHQLTLDNPTDERVTMFVAYFANALTAPEPGSPCDQGLDTTRSTPTDATGTTMDQLQP